MSLEQTEGKIIRVWIMYTRNLRQHF